MKEKKDPWSVISDGENTSLEFNDQDSRLKEILREVARQQKLGLIVDQNTGDVIRLTGTQEEIKQAERAISKRLSTTARFLASIR